MSRQKPKIYFRADSSDDWFNYNLRATRATKGYSAEKLASKVGISRNAVYSFSTTYHMQRMRLPLTPGIPKNRLVKKFPGV